MILKECMTIITILRLQLCKSNELHVTLSNRLHWKSNEYVFRFKCIDKGRFV